jgi:hypothetical protein
MLPTHRPIYTQYSQKEIDVIIIDDTKSKRRSGGRPSIKGVLGLNLETGEEYLLYLRVMKKWSNVLSYLETNYSFAEETYAICDGDDKLQRKLEEYGYKIQQCTNHFIKTSMYYLWKEQYSKEDRLRIKKEISRIISTLKNSVKKHRKDLDFARLEWRVLKTQEELHTIAASLLAKDRNSKSARFIQRTATKVTLFAELTQRGIEIPDTNNHIENLMGIIAQRVKKNRQSWIDENLDIMLKTIWQIIS